MHDPELVRRLQPIQNLAADLRRLVNRKFAALLQPFGKREPLDPLHHQERDAILVAPLIEYASYTRMYQPAAARSLLLEALDHTGVAYVVRVQALDRHWPIGS
jgi:hypothetical protein